MEPRSCASDELAGTLRCARSYTTANFRGNRWASGLDPQNGAAFFDWGLLVPQVEGEDLSDQRPPEAPYDR